MQSGLRPKAALERATRNNVNLTGQFILAFMLTDRAAPADSQAPRAVVIGAGMGGLAAAMRLGAKGYAVTVIDRLDSLCGRGSQVTQGGHRFDLGRPS